MKQGNQFYLETQIIDEAGNFIDVTAVEKIVFTLGEIVKEYPSSLVSYRDNTFKIWLTQENTFNLEGYVEVEARVKFLNNTVMGSEVTREYVSKSINKDVL